MSFAAHRSSLLAIRRLWRSVALPYSGWLAAAVGILSLTSCAVIDSRQVSPPPPGIARVETIMLDGLPERLLIRGNDPAHNPVLLFVHGGPGFPGAPVRQINSELERYFTVVHWDQRGTGHSYSPEIPISTMQIEQFVRETLLVSHALCKEFNQSKIYLVGHSWGTLPAALAVGREPGLFHAYVALSQLVDIDECERRVSREALSYAHDPVSNRLADELRALGPPPYKPVTVQDRAADLIAALFPRVTHPITSAYLATLAFSSRYYSFPAMVQLNSGYHFSRNLLIPQLHGYDLRWMVPEMDTPVYFIAGREDATFGLTLQEEYFRKLIAPRGKRFVLFADCTHWPQLQQPRAFLAEMQRVRAETFLPSSDKRTNPAAARSE